MYKIDLFNGGHLGFPRWLPQLVMNLAQLNGMFQNMVFGTRINFLNDLEVEILEKY